MRLALRRVTAQRELSVPFLTAVIVETGDPHASSAMLARELRVVDPNLEIIILRDIRLRPEYVLEELREDDRVLVLPSDIHDDELIQAIAQAIRASVTNAATVAMREEMQRWGNLVRARLSVRSSEMALDALSVIQLVISRRPSPSLDQRFGRDTGALLARMAPSERLSAFAEQSLRKIWNVLDAAAELSKVVGLPTEGLEDLRER